MVWPMIFVGVPRAQGSAFDIGAFEYLAPTAAAMPKKNNNSLLAGNFNVTETKGHSLFQNYPNPFESRTTISWQLPSSQRVLLKVFDTYGKEIALLVDEEQPAGTHRLEFETNGLLPGVYYYTLEAGDFRETRRMGLMR